MKFMLTPTISSDLYEEWNKMTKEEELELLANRTASAFEEFISCLMQFKKIAGLKTIDNPYEVMTSMSDKTGRICRMVKHVERKDPKIDWRHEILQSLTGYLSYSEMLIQKYNMINILHSAMMSELQGSVSQHAMIEENKDREHVECMNNDVVLTSLVEKKSDPIYCGETTKIYDDPALRSDVTKREAGE